MRRSLSIVIAVVVACVPVVSACGVGTEDEPQLIEESTEESPTETPSFDTEPSPATSTPSSAASTTSSPVSSTTTGPAPTR